MSRFSLGRYKKILTLLLVYSCNMNAGVVYDYIFNSRVFNKHCIVVGSSRVSYEILQDPSGNDKFSKPPTLLPRAVLWLFLTCSGNGTSFLLRGSIWHPSYPSPPFQSKRVDYVLALNRPEFV